MDNTIELEFSKQFLLDECDSSDWEKGNCSEILATAWSCEPAVKCGKTVWFRDGWGGKKEHGITWGFKI